MGGRPGDIRPDESKADLRVLRQQVECLPEGRGRHRALLLPARVAEVSRGRWFGHRSCLMRTKVSWAIASST